MKNFRLDDESGHQEALFSWAGYNMGRMPELEYMHHVPNGGKRDRATAVALKRQGVKAGVPDIVLPAARAERTKRAYQTVRGRTGERMERSKEKSC